MKKTALSSLAIALSACMLVLTGCGTAGGDGGSTTTQVDRAFSLDELAQYNGQNGQPAYVAVDGVVYDVSASSLWQAGVHSKCNLGASAGQDLSDVITQAPPNMRSLLQNMPIVGHLE